MRIPARSNGRHLSCLLALLVGTAGDDVIAGLRGDDDIRGRGGDDLLCGGGGDDALYGGTGDDRLDGGPGRRPGHHFHMDRFRGRVLRESRTDRQS